MAPESHFSNPFLPSDKSLAVQMVQASRYEQSHVAAAKPNKKHANKKMNSDTASVSSFGSTASLLKTKFSSSSSTSAGKSSTGMQKNILRSQMNIVG